MTKPINPSSWVLNSTPDLTPDQIWFAIGFAGQPGERSLRHGVVIADNLEAATHAVENDHHWTPMAVINETSLNEQIAIAENAPAHVVRNRIGWGGTERFALMYATDDPCAYRVVWVLAASEPAARSAWPELGESQAPKLVLPFADLVVRRDQVRQVRLDRANGARAGGRRV